MTETPRDKQRDLVLPPGTYAYMQDVTKGQIKTYTGPTVINPTAQERPVVYHAETGMFDQPDNLNSAMELAPVANEGFYLILRNPAKGTNIHPSEGSAQTPPELDVGRKINIPGPATFALWPGQAAEVVQGHHIRFNQYLLVSVYNEDEAKKNWKNAIMKTVSGADAAEPVTPEQVTDLTIGKQLIIKGTDVSFYIPPTGVQVVKEGNDFIRDALTLERLEYCILVDEDGNKRYEVGPKVVFPEPTERFLEDRSEGRPSKKFRAIELNEIQGLHIKVIADYEDNGRKYKAGEELFITGKDTQIYYPREEHSAIKYDGKAKHFATAIPAGEARYLMNRLTGEIKMVKGPAMLLPDPRTEVIVRRVLSEKQVNLWYPGNTEAAEYNRSMRAILQRSPTTRAGAVSEGDVSRGLKQEQRTKGGIEGREKSSHLADNQVMYAANASVMESSRVSGDQSLVGDEFSRASNYTQPRTLTLDTKYQGAPIIELWTGYAAMVVSKTGKRRVEKGPNAILLEYDEGLEVLELSTGKPKTTDTILKTVYLRVDNNKITDYVSVETADHVQVTLYLSYQVSFEGESTQWFAVENYVKFLCDHVRSVLKGYVKKQKAEDFYANATDLIRDTILGKPADGAKRPGMRFVENGMRVIDVEVLRVELKDEKIRALLDTAQHEVVSSNIELSRYKRRVEVTEQTEKLVRSEAQTKAETKQITTQLAIDALVNELALTITKISNESKRIQADYENVKLQESIVDLRDAAALNRHRALEAQTQLEAEQRQNLAIEMLEAEAKSVAARFAAIQGGFSEALLSLSNNETLTKVAEALNIQRVLGGDSVSEAVARAFAGTPLASTVTKLLSNGNGKSQSTPVASPPVS
jgi:major vault protein